MVRLVASIESPPQLLAFRLFFFGTVSTTGALIGADIRLIGFTATGN